MHELALEDCASVSSRPKIDDYPNYFFVVLNAAKFIRQPEQLINQPLFVFAGDGYVVNVCEGQHNTVDQVRTVIKSPWIRERTSMDILYLLMDNICDRLLPTIDSISEVISDLEEKVYESPDQEIARHATSLRKVLTLLRRTVTGHREIVSHLLKKHPPCVQPPLDFYFRDVHDHLMQATDLIETDRDLLAGLIDISLSVTAHRTNEIMKTLTIYATALLPMNVVTGYFGMNFAELPFIHNSLGAPLVTALLLLMVVATVIYFRRRHW